MTNSMIKYQTTFESTNNLPMNIEIGHGENADLVASFKDGGIDVNLSGYTAMAIFQPKSKWETDEWYECPCEIVDNTVITHWNYASDNGDSAVKLFIYASKDGVIAYPAIYQIKLFNTPGFDPQPIAPVPKIIDFSQYTLLNAPWAMLSNFNTLSTDVDSISNATDTLQGNVTYLSSQVDLKANVSDFNALTTNVNTIGNSVTTLQTNVTSLSGQMGTVQTDISNTQNLIFNGIDTYSTLFPNYKVTPLNRRMSHLFVSQYNSGNIKIQLPANPVFTMYYAVLTVTNQNSTTAYFELVQPESGTWKIAIEEGLNLSDILQVPTGKTVIFYLHQMRTGTTTGSQWGTIHIRKEICQEITI